MVTKVGGERDYITIYNWRSLGLEVHPERESSSKYLINEISLHVPAINSIALDGP